MAGVRRLLHAVLSGQRISKDAERGGPEGEYYKQKRNEAEKGERTFWMSATPFWVVEKACFVQVDHRRRDKENGDVDPIGGLADHAVVGVEKDGDQNKTHENTAKLHTPEVLAVAEEKALHDGEEEHRPKE